MFDDRELDYILKPLGLAIGASLFDTPDDCIIVNDKIRIDLKGAKKENVSITVVDNKIKIIATKKNIHNKETKFEKVFILGSAYDPNKVSATYEDSILEITAQLLESKQPRTINIS